MFQKFSESFNKLPSSNKSLVYLMWIYSFGALIGNLFIIIYIYKFNQSINDLIIYGFLHSISIFIWFGLIWYLIALFQKSIRYLFMFSYIAFIFSILWLLFFWDSYIGIYSYAVLFWLWIWMYWNAAHTQELANITNKERDFYSSSVAIWKNILQVCVPLLVALIFFIGWHLNLDGYIILFALLPLTYLLSFYFIWDIQDYTPKKITFHDIKNTFDFKKYKYGNLNFILQWFQTIITAVILPLIWFYMLKTEINIWLLEWSLAIMSVLLIIFFSFRREENTRLKYLAFFAVLYFFNYMFLALHFYLLGFVIFSLLALVIKPLFRVSTHVYDLSIMDNVKTATNDFYPAMIMREFFLLLGRILWLSVLIFIVTYYNFTDIEIYKGGLFITGSIFLLLIVSIYLWEKYEK